MLNAKHLAKWLWCIFDAHTDTYANGSKFDHGTMFYHAPNEGLIDPQHSVQIGIRTEHALHNNGFTTWMLHPLMIVADDLVAQN